MKSIIRSCIQESAENFQRILMSEDQLGLIEDITNIAINSFRKGNKILLCGNGGSASDAQHIAAELSGRFYVDRPPLYAEALHVNSSYMTAVANDYGYDLTYARMVEAAGKEEDILIGISTSGNSINVIKALEKAKEIGMKTIGFTGRDGGRIYDICDFCIRIPSDDTPRIQEAHILIGHIICQLIESKLFIQNQ